MTTLDAETVNSSLCYTMWAVFALEDALPADEEERAALVADAERSVATDDGLTVRGWYDVSGLRADADLMVWWHAATVEQVQGAYQRLRASELGSVLTPVWSVVGLHRPAEFNRSHVPAFLAGEEPGADVCVYPFVRSYDWYVLPEAERSRMLAQHGRAAAPFPDVRANTVATFALSDYEFLLAFEAPELHRIVDLMRTLRGVDARLHVREEVPFFTGPRTSLADWAGKRPLR